MDRLPLGSYSAFSAWSGAPRHWGPKGAGWRAWFAGNVIDGLCEVLDEHLAAGHSTPAAIGCVPWFKSDAVADRLLRLEACCTMIDKGAGVMPLRLHDHGKPFPNVLPELRWTMPAQEGESPMLGPSSPLPMHEVGPVRVVGWRRGDPPKPLLHAKLLVLGALRWRRGEPEYGPELEEWRFFPHSVWWGSANWTTASASHREVGFWSDDARLAQEATSFLGDLIAFSEPIQSVTAGPEPNLVTAEVDEDAMAEAAREHWLDHLADEADEWD